DKLRGVDLRVECKLGDLAAALRSDLEVGPQLKDELNAIEAGLLYLHDNGVLILDRGKTVFRSAMTIRINPEGKSRGFTNADFEPLKEHYNERNFQIHVIQEYAKLGLKKLSDALSFVLAYFSLPKLEFIRRYFAGRKEILLRATTEESYRRIVESLRHPVQQRLVAEKPDANRLILAGPGSGKTRVIVHRVAYLVRVLREPAGSIIVLAFNRGAAWEIRRRLRNLIDAEAGAVTILTYHALALRLTGTSLASLAETNGDEAAQQNLDRFLDEAISLLEGKSDLGGLDTEGDELRERLLAGYRYILVDEYQDIDQRQYDLIGALAGRQTRDKDARLTFLAVGDDDQNIYAFRGSSNDFIHRFQQDYQASVEYLVENYRSTARIIDAANELISLHRNRMKVDHPIRIDHARKDDPAGGRFQRLDPLGQGRVQILEVPRDAIGQAVVVMTEFARLKSLDAAGDWSDFAVLARNRATLDPVRAWCHLHAVAYRMSERDGSGPKFHQTREAYRLLDLLRAKPNRRVTATALSRWFDTRFADSQGANPWLVMLGSFIEELNCVWGDLPIPSSTIIEELFEFAADAARSEQGRLTLSTVHSAKGREFRHVAILDNGDWKEPSDDERRLYYVGMTRAKESLLLCESIGVTNPFSGRLFNSGITRVPVPEDIERPKALGLRYISLGLNDVNLGFAGRKPQGHPIHKILEQLEYDSPLDVVETGKRIELRGPESKVSVGAIAKSCRLSADQIVSIRVDTLIRRFEKQSDPGYAHLNKVEAWWVPIVTVTIAPADESQCYGSREPSISGSGIDATGSSMGHVP
ncbi:MAG: UvrD-helicase domain-containing protein, partial [Gammaproteobacteria bacterium]